MADAGDATRLIFLGERALAEGFRLIGFETWPDASVSDLDRLLSDLLGGRGKAFIIVDQALAAHDSKLLQRARHESGRIIVTEVPPLNDPGSYHLEIDDKVAMLTGGA